jgi:hypothetical protein
MPAPLDEDAAGAAQRATERAPRHARDSRRIGALRALRQRTARALECCTSRKAISGLRFGTARVLMARTAHDREGTALYCVTWTYTTPPDLTETAIRNQFDNVAGNYLGVPGLIRKYFGFSEDASSVIGIYLWETKDAADAFYSDEWLAGVTERWGAAPVKQEWIVPVVAESIDGRVVGADAPTPN